MKNIMMKSVCAIAVVSAIVLACSKNTLNIDTQRPSKIQMNFDENGYWRIPGVTFKKNKNGDGVTYYGTKSLYGAYLAGRVAHMRQDFDAAAEYYKIVMEKDADNVDVNRSIYIILTLLGNLDEASVYAQKEIDNGADISLAPLIVAIRDFHDGKYADVRKGVQQLNNPVYHTIINPFFDAWSYAGEKNEEQAIASIEAIAKDNDLISMKTFHKGMIYDYLGNKEKAAEMFSDIINNRPQDVTFRMLEIITDFYVRYGDKETARKISGRYNDNSTLAVLLADIDRKIDAASKDSPAIIDTPQKGMAEALFNIGTLFRASNGGAEYAQIFISASSFLNPSYDVSKIALANILEEIGLLKEANRYYAEIGSESGSYFIARIKMIENLNTLGDYDTAEDYLRQLLKDYPDNTQLLSSLGNIASGMNKNDEAIKIYKKALDSMPQIDSSSWPIYYSLAVSYDRNNQKDKAEESLRKALQLSNRHPNVLNYLGYSWLIGNKNTDEAIQMIVEAYQQYPYEGHIIDSLGWVYFRTGNYKKSIEYLEQASDMNPGNAVISDHLGDAYWFVGRKNEAVFQWKHALVLKEDSDLIDKDVIQAKIDDGKVDNFVLKIKDMNVLKSLNNLSIQEEKDVSNSALGAAK